MSSETSRSETSLESRHFKKINKVECGMRVCLAAALIAKCGGSIPSRVKKCKGIESLNEFTREHVVQSLTAKSLTPIRPIAVQCHPKRRDLRLL
jgi:hypothetical protein